MGSSEQAEVKYNPHWTASDEEFKEDPKEKSTFYIPARALNIIWGNDKRFWQWTNIDKEEHIFKEVAELLQVNWIEVTRKLDLSLPNLSRLVTYEIFYIVKFKVDAFGWHSAPIKFKITINGKKSDKSETLESYRKRHGIWHEIYGGEFTVPDNKLGIVEFGMYEVESDWWKGSIVLEGVKVKPKTGSNA